MNTNIRLFDHLTNTASLREFLSSFTEEEKEGYLQETFWVAAREAQIGILPLESVTLMFDLASILYNGDGPNTYQTDILNLLIRKTQDYNADRVNDPEYRLDSPRMDYFPFQHWSYLQMIFTKLNRIRIVGSKVGNPNFESVRDSIIDLGSYLIFYFSFLLEEQERTYGLSN